MIIPLHKISDEFQQIREMLYHTSSQVEIIYVIDKNIGTIFTTIESFEKIIKIENKGRGYMFLEGIQHTNGKVILFLHSDTILPINWDKTIRKSLENKENVGFDKENNQAIDKCAGNYILILNPDTLVLHNAVEKTVDFMDVDTTIGICGCKVINEDGTLQIACRRSITNTKVAFFRLTCFSKLFPNSKITAKYNLTYLDSIQSHEVDSVSVAFLMIRRNVIEEI